MVGAAIILAVVGLIVFFVVDPFIGILFGIASVILAIKGIQKEKTFLEHTREDICAVLQKLGIDAQIAPSGRIDIPKGAIRWITVSKLGGHLDPSGIFYVNEYGVPDPKLEPNFPKLWIQSVYKRPFPLIGKGIDLHWEGDELGLAVIECLNSDAQLKQPLVKKRIDVHISADGKSGCWHISIYDDKPRVPSERLWNCYQRIAQHLLEVEREQLKEIPPPELTEVERLIKRYEVD